MTGEKGTELHIRLDRKDVQNLNYDEIQNLFIQKMEEAGYTAGCTYETYDHNYKGRPNIYFRGCYKYKEETVNESELLSDGFIMFVKKRRG